MWLLQQLRCTNTFNPDVMPHLLMYFCVRCAKYSWTKEDNERCTLIQFLLSLSFLQYKNVNTLFIYLSLSTYVSAVAIIAIILLRYCFDFLFLCAIICPSAHLYSMLPTKLSGWITNQGTNQINNQLTNQSAN